MPRFHSYNGYFLLGLCIQRLRMRNPGALGSDCMRPGCPRGSFEGYRTPSDKCPARPLRWAHCWATRLPAWVLFPMVFSLRHMPNSFERRVSRGSPLASPTHLCRGSSKGLYKSSVTELDWLPPRRQSWAPSWATPSTHGPSTRSSSPASARTHRPEPVPSSGTPSSCRLRGLCLLCLAPCSHCLHYIFLFLSLFSTLSIFASSFPTFSICFFSSHSSHICIQ